MLGFNIDLKKKFTFGYIIIIGSFIVLFFTTNTIKNANERSQALVYSISNVQQQLNLVEREINDFLLFESKSDNFYQKKAQTVHHRLDNIFSELNELSSHTEKELAKVNKDWQSRFHNSLLYSNRIQQQTDSLLYLVEKRGFRDYGTIGQMRSKAHFFEELKYDFLENSILTLRRHEKDFLLRKDSTYVVKVYGQLNHIRELIHKSITNQKTKQAYLDSLLAYEEQFSNLVFLEFTIGTAEQNGVKHNTRSNLDQVEKQLDNLKADLSQHQTQLRFKLQIAILLVLFGLAVIVMWLGRLTFKNFADPVDKIIKQVNRIKDSEGENLSDQFQTVDVSNELGDLSQAIKLMLLQLDQRNIEIKKALKDIQKASNAKTEFLSRMSHELRTPLNACLSISTDLKEDPTKVKVDDIELLHASGLQVLSLVDDVLDYYKLESDTFELHPKAFTITDLVDQLRSYYQQQANTKGLLLKIDLIDIKDDQFYFADQSRLRQVISKLLDNAIKFTLSGEINLKIHAIKNDKNKSRIAFCVKDTGIGISNTKLQTIFDHFTQLENSDSRKYNGIGLSLALCQGIIHKMNSRISVESKPKVGSIFKFVLDLNKTQQHYYSADIFPENCKILLVDDNTVNIKIAEKLLTKWNYSYDVAFNGEEAVNLVKQHHYDCVLMDLQMPVMDGFEATSIIRSMDDNRKSSVPIIAITASALDETKKKVFAVKMNDFITKPYSPQVLRCSIEEQLKLIQA